MTKRCKSCGRLVVGSPSIGRPSNRGEAAYREAGKAIVAHACGLRVWGLEIKSTAIPKAWTGDTEISGQSSPLADNLIAIAPWRADPRICRCAEPTDLYRDAVDSILANHRVELEGLQRWLIHRRIAGPLTTARLLSSVAPLDFRRLMGRAYAC